MSKKTNKTTRKKFSKLSNKKTNNSIKEKKGKRFDQILHQGVTWMTDKHMKRCSTSLVIRRIQIKTALRVRYHYEHG